MFKCEWNFLWDEQKCSCVETAGWLVIKIIVSVFEAFGPPYLNRWNVFAIISHQHHEADTRASLSKSFTVTDMFNKRDSDLKHAVTGRRSFNHTAFLRGVCVCVFLESRNQMYAAKHRKFKCWLITGVQWWSWSAGVCSLQESLPISRGWSSPGSSWKMAARSPTTTSRRWAGNAAPEKWRLFCNCGLRVQFEI